MRPESGRSSKNTTPQQTPHSSIELNNPVKTPIRRSMSVNFATTNRPELLSRLAGVSSESFINNKPTLQSKGSGFLRVHPFPNKPLPPIPRYKSLQSFSSPAILSNSTPTLAIPLLKSTATPSYNQPSQNSNSPKTRRRLKSRVIHQLHNIKNIASATFRGHPTNTPQTKSPNTQHTAIVSSSKNNPHTPNTTPNNNNNYSANSTNSHNDVDRSNNTQPVIIGSQYQTTTLPPQIYSNMFSIFPSSPINKESNPVSSSTESTENKKGENENDNEQETPKIDPKINYEVTSRTSFYSDIVNLSNELRGFFPDSEPELKTRSYLPILPTLSNHNNYNSANVVNASPQMKIQIKTPDTQTTTITTTTSTNTQPSSSLKTVEDTNTNTNTNIENKDEEQGQTTNAPETSDSNVDEIDSILSGMREKVKAQDTQDKQREQILDEVLDIFDSFR